VGSKSKCVRKKNEKEVTSNGTWREQAPRGVEEKQASVGSIGGKPNRARLWRKMDDGGVTIERDYCDSFLSSTTINRER
jgi:hypothetical protein